MNCKKEFLFCQPCRTLKSTLLKKTCVSILIVSISLFACSKEDKFITPETCVSQTDNPSGRSYSSDSVIPVNYSKKNCGLIPLNKKNYWIYQDSLFNDGVFVKVQFDTLRFTSTFESVADKLIWWQSNISVGLPSKLYANDSAFFELENRMFSSGIMDVQKSYSLFEGDSVRYLSHFEDNAAMGRSVKMQGYLSTPAGGFYDYILFEKNARSYRKDQVYFKPGLGVLKYTLEIAPQGTDIIKLQQVSTLTAFHIE